MGKRKRYSAELQQELVRLVRTGRSAEELGREFEPSAQAIRNWVKRAELDEGSRTDGMKSEEREELARLRRENARLTRPPTTPGSRRERRHQREHQRPHLPVHPQAHFDEVPLPITLQRDRSHPQ